MITLRLTNFKMFFSNNSDNYIKFLDSLDLFQFKCTCGASGCFVRHGYYTRYIKIPQVQNSNKKVKKVRILILRVKCRNCNRTHALLPNFIVPYSQITISDQLKMIIYPIDDPVIERMLVLNETLSKQDVYRVKRRFRKFWVHRLRIIAQSIMSCKNIHKSKSKYPSLNVYGAILSNLSLFAILDLCHSEFDKQFMQINFRPNILSRPIHIT